MSYFPPTPPRTPPTMHIGLPAYQIGQPGTGHAAPSSSQPAASQPQKTLPKGSKADHAQYPRKNEYANSSAPWKDPRQVTAASAEHRRTMKDKATLRTATAKEARAERIRKEMEWLLEAID